MTDNSLVTSTDPVQIRFAGLEGAVTLEFVPDTGLDAGVRCSAIKLTLGPMDGEVATLPSTTLWGAARVQKDLADVLTSNDITGRTEFEFDGTEDDLHGSLNVRIDLTHGKGTIVARIMTDAGLQDGYAEICLNTDQTFLAATARELEALLGRFPRLRELL